MKCPNCGNELNPNEVFCGQCGAPGRLTSLPTEMVQTPPARSGQLNSPYNTQPGTGSYNAGIPSTSYPLSPNSNQSAMRSSGPQQQGEFYQDATEAMSIPPIKDQVTRQAIHNRVTLAYPRKEEFQARVSLVNPCRRPTLLLPVSHRRPSTRRDRLMDRVRA